MTAPEASLASFVASTRLEDVPADTLARVRLFVLDALACAFAGHPAAERPTMERVAAEVFGPGICTVLAGSPLAPAGAAFLNGFKLTAATVCDVHRATLTHVLPEVLPAALATAELDGASGRDLLSGLVVGMEVTIRVAQALDVPSYRQRGWHNPGIAGAIGAAAACARVSGLGETGIRHAISHAASQAAGTFAALGTSGVKVHQARGAVSGLLAGRLAAAGVTAAEDGLSAERGGLLAAYADGGSPEHLVDGLGRSWELGTIALRRWPGASSLQPVIAAALAIRETLDIEPGQDAMLAGIESVRVDLPPRAYAMNGERGWSSQLSALQSARWMVAVALQDGDPWVEQTNPERLGDPAVAGFAREQVTVAGDVWVTGKGARVTVHDRRGVEHVHQVDVPPGDPDLPLDAAAVRAKLERAAAGIGLGARVPAIVDAVGSLDAAPSVSAFLDLLSA